MNMCLLFLFVIITYGANTACRQVCEKKIWFGDVMFFGGAKIYTFDLVTNITTEVSSPGGFPNFSLGTMAWGPNNTLWVLEGLLDPKGAFIVRTNNNSEYANMEFQFGLPAIGNALDIDCDGVLYYTTAFPDSTLRSYDPRTGNLTTIMSLPEISGGDLYFTLMGDNIYFIGQSNLYKIDIDMTNYTLIGPVPLFSGGLAACGDTLYMGSFFGELYRVDMDPYQLVLIANTVSIGDMTIRYSQLTTNTTAPTFSTIITAPNITVPLLSTLVPLGVCFVVISLCILFVQRRKCQWSYDTKYILPNGRVKIVHPASPVPFSQLLVVEITSRNKISIVERVKGFQRNAPVAVFVCNNSRTNVSFTLQNSLTGKQILENILSGFVLLDNSSSYRGWEMIFNGSAYLLS